jgi:putative membrane-bound dehydrogenase-like protein
MGVLLVPPRLSAAVLVAMLSASPLFAQGFPPEEAAKRMKLPEGFSARCVASEPMIRQPTSISFDNRGRLWVLQYLQYPNYAGIKAVKQDQYLRTIWDKTPEPPPHGPRGADRITILYDPDEHGVFRKSRDFVTGLNIASGFCLGNGGVYVVQPPYLLFYADKNEDDVPDGDPEVLLSGFGMDDTHSLANSLQFGPDGWLYGAAGSTSTCRIANPANPKEVIEFQQGIWRYHPKTKRFELFSEGGGNTYGLDFDRNGQVIAGTNWGGFAMLHQMQGAYYVKGFSKHGPLHNPHAYGYFEHVPYSGPFQGGHVTCGGIVYQGDVYPREYQDQYIAANLLSNAVYWHKLARNQSSFTARHGGELIEANDTWFRPVDLLEGPDSCVYVVDFYDKRAAHLDPVDNWDKTNGRIYRIEYKGGPNYPAFDLRQKTTAELAELLKHPNVWMRREARQLIVDRGDKSIHPRLRQWLLTDKGQLALEALWTLYSSGGWMESDFENVIAHESEFVRVWAIRFLCDEGTLAEERSASELENLAATERSPVVLAQLACSARRLDPTNAIAIAAPLLDNPVVSEDPQLPLLIWWLMESANSRDATDTVRFPFPQRPALQPFFIERTARRFMSGGISRGLERIATLYQIASSSSENVAAFLRGVATALQAHPLEETPPALRAPLAQLRAKRPRDLVLLEVLARMNDDVARQSLREIVADAGEPDAARVKAAELLRQVRDPRAKELFLAELRSAKTDAVRTGLLAGLEAFDDPAIGETVLASYSGFSAAVKRRAIQLLVSRPAWAQALFRAADSGAFPKKDLTVDHARSAVALNAPDLTTLVEKQFGKLAPATAGEKQARISWLNTALGREKGADATRGKVLFTKHCSACHQLHGEGGKVGPDLTTADRKNRLYMLAQIVDPSGYIRPEYIVQNVITVDDRRLSGIATESGESIVLTTVVNDQPVKTVIAKKEIADIKPSAISLMPEKLLDTLTDSQIADLFAYLASDAPKKSDPPVEPRTKTLTLALVSGSFEYKSDASLAAFQKYLEERYPVKCVPIFAKSEKEIAGLDQLDRCDAAIFFTRRLTIDEAMLEPVKRFVKSGKPIIGLRTASHGFQNWLAMDKEVFGGDYQNHYQDKAPCDVAIVEKQKDHPILKGCSSFRSNGSLYKNPNVAADVTVLLTGSIPGHTEPVAWMREKDGRRVFYTSLGHPDDFKDENFLRLLVNALAWTTKSDLKPSK